MNELDPERRARLKRLLASGASIRATALAVPCSQPTVCRYAKLYKVSAICGCGQKAGHRGWCKVRLEYSSARRGWLQKRWQKRAESETTEMIDKAVEAAKAKGHTLGPFIWTSAQAASLAFAICRVCGKSVRVFSRDSQWERLQDWPGLAGTAITARCKTAQQRAAEEVARKDKRSWQSGKRTLADLKRLLRSQSRSRNVVSTPDQTSPR